MKTPNARSNAEVDNAQVALLLNPEGACFALIEQVAAT